MEEIIKLIETVKMNLSKRSEKRIRKGIEEQRQAQKKEYLADELKKYKDVEVIYD